MGKIKVSEYDKYEDEIRKLYCEDNLSYEEISTMLNIPINDLRNFMRRKGIKLSKDKLILRRKQGFINKYGVDNPFASEEIKRKIANTNISRYGVKVPTQSRAIKDKIKKTNLERYGTACVLQSRELCKNLYDRDYFSERNISDESLRIINDIDLFREFIISIPYSDRKYDIIANKLGVSYSTIGRRCDIYNLSNLINTEQSSILENIIRDYVTSLNIDTISTRKIIPPYEIDIYSDRYRIGIEFNGDYWHSYPIKSADYHQKKSLLGLDNGVFIYHIWEYEWNNPRKREIIKSQIRNLFYNNNKRIYARNCIIKEVSSLESRKFLNDNHIQGNRNSRWRYGLYYNNELVLIMTFGIDKFIDKSDTIQLLRFCSKLGYSVVGGASKLFKYFITQHNPSKIVSYCDIAKGRGIVYEKLGFKLDKITSCNYVWSNGIEIKTRYQSQKRFIKESDNDNRTEYEIMSNKGYYQIFDCGSYKYVWNKD